jgi:hypothetical protein
MLAAVLVAGLCTLRPGPAQPIALRSDGGHFTLRVTGLDHPERLNLLHGFDLSLATADGSPVSGASIVLAGRRRTSSNPLPTAPRVSPAPGEGNYRVEGLRLHMPGEWHLVFEIEFAHIRDRAALGIAVR